MRFFLVLFQRMFTMILVFFQSRTEILMFHEVESECTRNIYSVSLSNFEKLIQKHHERFISIEDIRYTPKNEVRFVLTFDDVYENAIDNCTKILDYFEIPYYIFVTTNYIDKPGYITTEQLVDLSKKENCFIGSHGVTHQISRFMSIEEFRNELIESKTILEALTHREVVHFAFPYGSIFACSRENIKAANSIYSSVFSTLDINFIYHNGFISSFIPRRNINNKKIRRLLNHGE